MDGDWNFEKIGKNDGFLKNSARAQKMRLKLGFLTFQGLNIIAYSVKFYHVSCIHEKLKKQIYINACFNSFCLCVIDN